MTGEIISSGRILSHPMRRTNLVARSGHRTKTTDRVRMVETDALQSQQMKRTSACEHFTDVLIGIALMAARTAQRYASQRHSGECANRDEYSNRGRPCGSPVLLRPWIKMNYLNLDTAIAAIRYGFVPWACTVKVFGFEKRLQCQTVDIGGKPIIEAFWLSSTEVVDPRKLRGSIELTRAKLEQEGYALEPWHPRW